MRRDTIMRYLTAIALTLVLAACGGGGSSAQGKGIVGCTGDAQGFTTASELHASTQLQANSADAKIRLWHLSDGTRKACVIEGSVEVLL